MLFTIILFFFALAIAFSMIARKIWQFRTNRIIPGSYEEADWHDLSIESVRERLIELAKFSVHHGVLTALKLWIIISSAIRRTDAKVKSKLTQVIHKNGHLSAEGKKPSGFMSHMQEHKKEMASAMEKESSEEM